MANRKGSARFAQPEWFPLVEDCPSCGYSLSGLPEPRRCPECGGEYGGGTLVLSGVVGAVRGGRPGRRLAWIGVLALLIPLLYAWPLLIMIDPMLIVISGTVALCGVIALLATSKRERQGRERLAITSTGIARKPLRAESVSDTAFVPLPPGAIPELTRVSAHWGRLRVRDPALSPRRLVLDAGFACDAAHWPEVEHAIASLRGPPLEQE